MMLRSAPPVSMLLLYIYDLYSIEEVLEELESLNTLIITDICEKLANL